MYRHNFIMLNAQLRPYNIYFKRPISVKVLVCPLYIKTKRVVHFTGTVNVSNLSLDHLLCYYST